MLLQEAMRLRGKTALVTGGGRGIGAATARALATAGAAVAVAARTRAEVERVAASILSEGGSARPCVADVTTPADVESLVKEVTDSLGPIDILVCGAGHATSAPLLQTPYEEFESLWRAHLGGALLCIQATLPGMLQRSWGRIVTIASVAGRVGAPYISAYASAKHALVGLTRCLAMEVAGRGVTANSVCPGYVDTPMTAESIQRIMRKTGCDETSARQALEQNSPQKRLMSADEVGHLVLMLCDDRARGINGQAIVLDGGGVQA
jgi:NAD(P)-dependent dehydrogenase (short-subunit alcohol dehydrogenase family)